MGVYEKNTAQTQTLTSFDSIVRFAGHVQLKGCSGRTVEAYVCIVRLLARRAGSDPAELSEERVREFVLHLLNERGYAPKSMRQARAALVSFFTETLGVEGWTVFRHVRTKDREQLPVVLSRGEPSGAR